MNFRASFNCHSYILLITRNIAGRQGNRLSNLRSQFLAPVVGILTRSQSLALDDGNGCSCQRLTRERAYSPVLKYNEGLWKSQAVV